MTSPPPLRVLLVEDDADDHLLLRELLAEQDVPAELDWVRTWEAGLSALGRGEHAVCLTDVRLGARTGIELLEEARRLGCRTPVILLTGQGDGRVVLQALRAGAADYLTKAELTGPVLSRSLRYVLDRAEAAESRRLLEAAVEQATEAIAILSPGTALASARFVRVNAAFCRMTGYSQDEVLGRSPGLLEGPNTHTAVLARFHLQLQHGEAFEGDAVCYRKDGSQFHAEWHAAPVRDARGALTHFVSTWRDVTERRELQLRLQVSDRMASLGTLAAGMAHELNNPLAYVYANLGFALEGLGELLPALRTQAEGARLVATLDEVREALAEARDGAERLRRLVRDLKTFSRADQEQRTRVDVRQVVEVAQRMAANEVRHRARLVTELLPVPAVMADEARLAQVLINLLVNAAQAIPEGDVAGNRIHIRTRTGPHGHAVVEVADTGRGIAPEHRSRIFDPFFTTKPPGVGTGLGLSLCHSIVTALHGELEVESEVGKGSLFRVTLPAAEPEDAELPAPATTPPPPGRRGRLLLVDDEPAIGAAYRRVLAREHDVVVLQRGADALRMLEAGERFDVLLLDMMMPEMSGADLYEELERRWPALRQRVIFLTGGAFTPRARTLLERVSNPHLHKPVAPEELRRRVAGLLAGNP